MKKSYYSGCYYIDTTTGRKIIPKDYCELCGTKYGLTQHHFLNQQKCLRDLNSKKVRYPKMWTQEFINENQKIFSLCMQCHSDVEHLSNQHFYQKYGIERSNFIYAD